MIVSGLRFIVNLSVGNAQVEQVWIPGVHSDVGGGYQECDLSNITLSWMMRKAKENGLLLCVMGFLTIMHKKSKKDYP